jgi:hypothetical protein
MLRELELNLMKAFLTDIKARAKLDNSLARAPRVAKIHENVNI